jgi:hypothetical protein
VNPAAIPDKQALVSNPDLDRSPKVEAAPDPSGGRTVWA